MTEPAAAAETAGSLLRAAREKQGLHIAALAAAIKVAQRKLEALEGDRYDELPDATFTRALAQTVCRTLKIDARPVLERLPPAPAVVLEPGSGTLNTPFRDRPGRGEEPAYAAVLRQPVAWAVAALLLAAAAVLLAPPAWWAGLRPASVPPAATLPASGAAAADLPSGSPATVPQGATPAASASQEASAAVAAASAGATAGPATGSGLPAGETVFAAQNPEPPASASAVTGGVPGAPAAPAVALPAGLVQLRSTEASWVEARDARGQLLLSRTVQPGESIGLDGSLPIRLVIGNAAATQLGFRGQPVDLASSTRDNVARVELR